MLFPALHDLQNSTLTVDMTKNTNWKQIGASSFSRVFTPGLSEWLKTLALLIGCNSSSFPNSNLIEEVFKTYKFWNYYRVEPNTSDPRLRQPCNVL
jgi:hypothetical protein